MLTIMHSSGMRTARLLTVSQHALGGGGGVYPSMHWAGEVSAAGGVSAEGGVCPGGICPGVSAREVSA